MLVNKKTVLNENYVRVHVRWIVKRGPKFDSIGLIESNLSPWSIPRVSKKISDEFGSHTIKGAVKLIQWVKIGLSFCVLCQNCFSLRVFKGCLDSYSSVCQEFFKMIC